MVYFTSILPKVLGNISLVENDESRQWRDEQAKSICYLNLIHKFPAAFVSGETLEHFVQLF